eukprot:GEMP01049383.1.p1 GENE.GEMP01049383.1~~GEMP01049383.1.p1  ORF type:complete len:306 (+),score=63.34 GEMP01049383.1:262-1179(+)
MSDLMFATKMAPAQQDMANVYDQPVLFASQPVQQEMDDYGRPLTQKGDLGALLGHRDGLLIKQTMKGCCCQRLNEFSVHEYVDNYKESEDAGSEVMFVAERAGPCLRCLSHFAPGFRKTAFDTWLPNERGTSQPFMTHEKTCTNGRSCWIAQGDGGPVRVPCCCNLPYLETKNATGQVIGRTQYVCDSFLLVPKYEVLDGSNVRLFRIRPNTCIGGCCVKCECGKEKGRCFAVPYYIRNPQAPHDPVVASDGKDAEITNFWSSMTKECCMRQNYALKFPRGVSPDVKATLMGSTFLIEMLDFEQT